ncbi:hypothetical protein Tco_0711190 [Tanacetum coccineum]
MAAVEVPQTLEYRGDHPFIPMTADQRKPEGGSQKDNLAWILRNSNHVKDFELASLFGKLKYEENLIEKIYETEKNKSLISATPLSTAFISTSIVQDFQDYPDYEEDTRSSHEYLNDLEEEYQARALLAKSKRFFKKALKGSAVQKQLTKLNATNVARKHKPELRPSNDFEAKYNKVKAKLALLKEVSSDDNEMVEVKLLMALAGENDAISKEGARNGELMKISMRKLLDQKSPTGVERPWLSEAEGFTLPNHDTVCSTPIPLLKKLDGAEPVSGPKTIKSILRSKSTFKAETLKGIIINEPSSAPAKSNKSSSASKVNSAPAVLFCKKCERIDHITYDHAEYISTKNMSQHLKSLGRSTSRSKNPRPSKHFFLPCIHCGFNDHLFDDCVNYLICDICGSYDHDTHGHNRIISLRRGIKPRNPQHVMKSYETCGSTVHTTTDHNDIKWFRRGKELQAKKAKALKSTKAESTNANRSKTPTKRWCLEMTLHAQLKVTALSNVMFDEKRGTLLNSNKKVVMIAPRVRDVYVLDMTSSTQESCYFAKASVEN